MLKPEWLTNARIDATIGQIQQRQKCNFYLCHEMCTHTAEVVSLESVLSAAGITIGGSFKLTDDLYRDAVNAGYRKEWRYAEDTNNARRIAWLRSLKESSEILPASDLPCFQPVAI